MALIDKINDGFIAVTNLLKGKVNKTDVIAVAQGGTGGTDAETARSNLRLGTAATATLTTSIKDVTIGRVVKVGDFGIGSALIETNTDMSSYRAGSILSPFSGTMSNAPPNDGQRLLYNGFGNINYMAQMVLVQNGSFWIKAGQPHQFANLQWIEVYTSYSTPISDVAFKSLKSGSSSYKKGWRKLTATLPSQAGEVTVAHGVTTVETVQAKVTNTDGIIIYNNDIDPTNQFYVRVNGANLILGVTANSTKVFSKTVTIYVGEEL